MKILAVVVFLFAGSANAGALNRYSCNGGKSLFGSEMTINTGGWMTAGAVKYANPLPAEFEWTGSEAATLSVNDVISDLTQFGPLNTIQGADFLSGTRKFTVLQSKLEAASVAQTNKIYVENELLDGRRNSGLIVYTRVTSTGGGKTEALAEVATCERLVTKGEAALPDEP